MVKSQHKLSLRRVRTLDKYRSHHHDRNGFLLGVVLLVCIIMGVFIFSYNSIVRQRNIQAHHLMISETANYLAVSGLRLLSDKLGSSYETTIKASCPQLFNKTAEETGSTIDITGSNPVCNTVKNDFQNFLNSLDELADSSSGYPICHNMDIRLEEISRLSPDTTTDQLQAGRDPIEKCGQIVVRCEVEFRGLRRQATLARQFRVISMVPGPFCRFSLFVKKTPYPDSYNSMGVSITGDPDTSYLHPPAGNVNFPGPLWVFNGTDTETINNDVTEKTVTEDKDHLRKRGWVFLGPSGSGADEAVFIKIPSGFNSATGGHFMMGWPSLSAIPVLAPEEITDTTSFASNADFTDHEIGLGAKYQGFFTTEDGNPYGAGAHNLWPGLSAGPNFVPSDHIRSTSTWLYPFGNRARASRTLVFGPVLAGFLKSFFYKGKNLATPGEFKGIWSGMSESLFDSKIAADHGIESFAGLYDGNADPPLLAADLFKNGYDSFKKVMPYNSLPSPSPTLPTNGIAFNLLFDFMKYQRSQYPGLHSAPSICAVGFDAEKFLVPQAEEMRTCPVKGVHPYDETAIYFKENGQYDPNSSPDNCYFYGDLSNITVFQSNLLSNRITHKLDLKSCPSLAQEQDALEKFLFKKLGSGATARNESDKTGIFLIRRRAGVTDSHADALKISSLPLKLIKPQIIIFDRGSVIIEHDITSNLKDGAPETLFSLNLINGYFFIQGPGSTRKIHAYLCSLNNNSGRLLKSPSPGGPTSFEIHGGLALTEIGLYEDPMTDSKNYLGTTMLHFRNGGEINYNPRFNPSSPAYEESRVFVIEDTAGKFSISGAGF